MKRFNKIFARSFKKYFSINLSSVGEGEGDIRVMWDPDTALVLRGQFVKSLASLVK